MRVKGKETPVAIYQALGRKDELSEQVQMIARVFEAAFARYQACDWDGATKMLTDLKAAAPCSLCDIYLERIAHFREARRPPTGTACSSTPPNSTSNSMKLTILGCSGGIGSGRHTTCFKVDDDILIDAGTGITTLKSG